MRWERGQVWRCKDEAVITADEEGEGEEEEGEEEGEESRFRV